MSYWIKKVIFPTIAWLLLVWGSIYASYIIWVLVAGSPRYVLELVDSDESLELLNIRDPLRLTLKFAKPMPTAWVLSTEKYNLVLEMDPDNSWPHVAIGTRGEPDHGQIRQQVGDLACQRHSPPTGMTFLKNPTHLHGREDIDTRYASITDCIEQFVAVNETHELTIEIFENDELLGEHKILYRFVQNGIESPRVF